MKRSQIQALHPLSLSVRRLFHLLESGAAALHGESDISVGMRAVLESVIDGGPQTVPQMARARPVTRQHIQGLVNPLIDGSYVEYVDNPAHRRSKLVAATKKGRRAFQALRDVETHALGQLPLDVTPEEIDAATSVLHRLTTAFKSREWRSIVERENPNPNRKE